MPAIALHELTKRYGAGTALDGLTVEVPPGRITAFLGANDRARRPRCESCSDCPTRTSGQALIGTERYSQLENPQHVIGAVLDQGLHPNRTARNHPRIVAAQAKVSRTRIDEVLIMVGGGSPGRRILPRHAAASRAGLGDDRRSFDPGAR